MTARAFAYRPNEIVPLEGTTQVGDLAVQILGDPAPSTSFSEGYGGLRWWNGPNEELGLVIARPNPLGDQPNPDGEPTCQVSFYGKLSQDDFRSYAGLLSGGTEFATAGEASTWLTANGYWNNFGIIY
jgi:hypothetical protein